MSSTQRERRPLAAHTERGPHPVGLAVLDLPDPGEAGRRIPVDVWYPADPEAYGTRDRAAHHPLNRPHEARIGARPDAGPYPLVAFSHGNSGFRRQSTFLTTHLASWGFVVVAPDHTGNTVFEMAQIAEEDERIRVHKSARENRPRDLVTAIDAVVRGAREKEPAWAPVREDRIGALGHSYGGWTALKMPGRDPRVRAVCGLAPASEPFVGRKAFAPGELPFRGQVPTMLVAALDDVLVDVDSSVRPLHARLGEPRALVGVGRADHFHFCDGVELLHALHERNRRPQQTRETRPYAELLEEARVHRLIRGLVTAFFSAALDAASLPDLGRAALADLDPELVPVDVPCEADAAVAAGASVA